MLGKAPFFSHSQLAKSSGNFWLFVFHLAASLPPFHDVQFSMFSRPSVWLSIIFPRIFRMVLKRTDVVLAFRFLSFDLPWFYMFVFLSANVLFM